VDSEPPKFSDEVVYESQYSLITHAFVGIENIPNKTLFFSNNKSAAKTSSKYHKH